MQVGVCETERRCSIFICSVSRRLIVKYWVSTTVNVSLILDQENANEEANVKMSGGFEAFHGQADDALSVIAEHQRLFSVIDRSSVHDRTPNNDLLGVPLGRKSGNSILMQT